MVGWLDIRVSESCLEWPKLSRLSLTARMEDFRSVYSGRTGGGGSKPSSLSDLRILMPPCSTVAEEARCISMEGLCILTGEEGACSIFGPRSSAKADLRGEDGGLVGELGGGCAGMPLFVYVDPPAAALLSVAMAPASGW